MLRTLAEKVDAKHAALLIVDVQHDVCADDRLRAVVEPIERLLHGAREAGLLVAFALTAHSEHSMLEVWEEQRLRVHGHDAGWPCLEGTPGAQPFQVAPGPTDYVVHKRGFSALAGTDLDVVLRGNGIRTLIVAGLTADGSVSSTVRDAHNRGYYCVAVADCTAALEPDRLQATLSSLDALFGVVVPSADLLAVWRTYGAGQAARSR